MAFARYYVEVMSLGAPAPVVFTVNHPWIAVAVRGFNRQAGRLFHAVTLRTQPQRAEIDVVENGVYEVLFSDAPLDPRSLDKLPAFDVGQGIADPAIGFTFVPRAGTDDVKVGNEDPPPPPPPSAAWIFTNSGSLT